eukprot:2650770-Prymnesium_polylepis.1
MVDPWDDVGEGGHQLAPRCPEEARPCVSCYSYSYSPSTWLMAETHGAQARRSKGEGINIHNCAEIPPVSPARTEAMHDPRCCGVAARTGPG